MCEYCDDSGHMPEADHVERRVKRERAQQPGSSFAHGFNGCAGVGCALIVFPFLAFIALSVFGSLLP